MTENLSETQQTNPNQGEALDETPEIQLDVSLAIQSLDSETRAVVDQFYEEVFKVEQFTELVFALNSEDVIFQHRGCIGLRKLLSNEDNPPIQNAIDLNCVSRFFEFTKSALPVLQLEATWCLKNITFGTAPQTQYIIDNGAIPLFCKLLSSKFSDISAQAIEALRNLSGEGSRYRDLILKCGGMVPLLKILIKTKDKKAIETTSNLCRGHPLAEYQFIKDATEPLCKLLMQEFDEDIIMDSSWAISYLSEGDDERIQRVINTGVVAKLVEHIRQKFLSILIPCLRILGNICMGNNEQRDFVLSSGALPEIFKLINHKSNSVRLGALQVLSHIAEGTSQQISSIIQTNEYVEDLFKHVRGKSKIDSCEAIQVLSNCTSSADHMDILKLVDMKIFEVYASVLKSSKYATTLTVVLDSIRHILESGDKHKNQGDVNPFVLQLKSSGLLDVFEELQKNPDEDVLTRVTSFIEKYLETEDSLINVE